jgi:hypothetical protein
MGGWISGVFNLPMDTPCSGNPSVFREGGVSWFRPVKGGSHHISDRRNITTWLCPMQLLLKGPAVLQAAAP